MLLNSFFCVRKRARRVGRGIGSGRGKTSSRGHKGQRARSSNLGSFEGGQIPIYRELPKRGFKRCFAAALLARHTVVTLEAIQRIADDGGLPTGSVIDIDSCKKLGLAHPRASSIKIIGDSSLHTRVVFKVNAISSGARAIAEDFGASVTIV